MSQHTANQSDEVAVVIVTRDRARVLADCLRSIMTQPVPPSQVVVVAGDSDSCPDTLLNRFSDLPVVRVFCAVPNISMARNIGLRATTCPIVCFIDDDAIAHPGWLAAYNEVFRDNPSVAAAGGDVLDARSVPPEAEFAKGLIYPTGRQIERRLANETHKRGSWLSVKGCNFAIHRDRLPASLCFDEFFRFAFDETDLVVTIQERGGRVMHAPAAIVDHLHAPGLYRTQNAHDRDWATEFASHTMFMLKHTRGIGRLTGWGVVLARLCKHALRLAWAAVGGSCEQRAAMNGISDAAAGIRRAVLSRGNAG